MDFLVLGAGYTGGRVARLLLEQGVAVHVTCRDPVRLAGAGLAGAAFHRVDAGDPQSLQRLGAALPKGVRVLHSVPLVVGPVGPADPTPQLLAALGDRPSRVVYLSTTGVYGDARQVDEAKPPMPATERARLRLEAERAVAAGPWSWMVLRPAAIYGPDRGVHVAMQAGRYKLVGQGDNYLSRIHVDDLAALCVAALRSEAQGAYPVADEVPATAREVAAFCAARCGLPMPPSVAPEQVHETLRADRRVDGSAVRRLLGVELRHPSYREGIGAACGGSAAP